MGQRSYSYIIANDLLNIILVKYINNFKTKIFKYRYRFSIGIGFALKFNIGTGIISNFGIGTSLIQNKFAGEHPFQLHVCVCQWSSPYG